MLRVRRRRSHGLRIGRGAMTGPRKNDLTPKFRAVKVGTYRRGIRLEQIYWDTLKQMTAQKGLGLGHYIERVASGFPEAVNITSVLRVHVVRWLLDRETGMKPRASPDIVDDLVRACPSPVFAVRQDERIAAWNPAFVEYVRSRFPQVSAAFLRKTLHLTLDEPAGDLIAALGRTDDGPVRCGFALTAEGRELRGAMSAALASRQEEPTILCYVAVTWHPADER